MKKQTSSIAIAMLLSLGFMLPNDANAQVTNNNAPAAGNVGALVNSTSTPQSASYLKHVAKKLKKTPVKSYKKLGLNNIGSVAGVATGSAPASLVDLMADHPKFTTNLTTEAVKKVVDKAEKNVAKETDATKKTAKQTALNTFKTAVQTAKTTYGDVAIAKKNAANTATGTAQQTLLEEAYAASKSYALAVNTALGALKTAFTGS